MSLGYGELDGFVQEDYMDPGQRLARQGELREHQEDVGTASGSEVGTVEGQYEEDEEEEEEEYSDDQDEDDVVDEEDMEDDVDAGVDDAMDVELHVALDELLGIRGPITVLLRNILWLLAFNCAYLGLFAFIPFSIGSSILASVRRNVDSPMLHAALELVPQGLRQVVDDFSTTAAKEDHTLQLPDLGTIALGYLVMSCMIFMWRAAVSAASQRTSLQLMGRVRLILDCTAAVVKVGILLFLKMLLLPLLLGVCLDAATLRLFTASAAERVHFTAQNLVGSLLLHWVLGITFMLFVTVSVLQLREVLHPDIFAAIIRPQEPHPDLLGSLLQESGATHARRMIMSLAIYVFLLFVFVSLPTSMVLTWAPTAVPLELNLAYIAPQLQVPVELVIFHLSVLGFLERFKNRIGELQHIWLVRVSGALGLTRYLLPLPRLEAGPEGAPGPLPAPGGQAVGVAGEEKREEEDEEDELVGAPLQRPPPGWDDLAGGGQGRWAWGNEEPTEVERNLAKRRTPDRLTLRLGVLLGLGWATVLCLVLLGTWAPLVLGRRVFQLLRIPTSVIHDPFAFALGIGFCLAARPLVAAIYRHLTRGSLETWCHTMARRPPSLITQATVAVFALLWLGIAPLCLGTMFELVFCISEDAWAAHGLGGLSLRANWLLGLFLVHAWACTTATFGDAMGTSWRPVLVAARRELVLGLGTGDLNALTWECLVTDLALPVALDAGFALLCPVALMGLWTLSTTGEWVALDAPNSPLRPTTCRRLAVTWLIAVLANKCLEPVSRWLSVLHDAIRDDEYLVGLELENYHTLPEAADPPGTTKDQDKPTAPAAVASVSASGGGGGVDVGPGAGAAGDFVAAS